MGARVIIRADGGKYIGLGHIRRAMVLGDLLEKKGASAFYAVDEDMARYLSANGAKASQILPATGAWGPHSHVLTDINWTGNAASAAREVARLCQESAAVAVIDSMPPDHFMALPGAAPDLLVTPYLNARSYRPATSAGQWLAGGEYVVVDPAIAARFNGAPPPNARVLLSCGGSDPEALSLRALDALLAANVPVDVVVGPLFSDQLLGELNSMASGARPGQVCLHQSPDGLGPLLSSASLVVGRVGLLRYEAATLALGGIYLQFGHAYRDYLAAFSKSGAGEVYFASDDGGEAAFLSRLRNISARDFERNDQARKLVDGKGAERVVQAVLNLRKHAE